MNNEKVTLSVGDQEIEVKPLYYRAMQMPGNKDRNDALRELKALGIELGYGLDGGTPIQIIYSVGLERIDEDTKDFLETVSKEEWDAID